jgi:hypothetical protein
VAKPACPEAEFFIHPAHSVDKAPATPIAGKVNGTDTTGIIDPLYLGGHDGLEEGTSP